MNPLKRKLETTATHLRNGEWSALGDKARRNVGAMAAPLAEAGTLLRDAYTFRRRQQGKGTGRIAPSLGADIPRPQGRKKNVIWIMLDALRADIFHTFLERGGLASLGRGGVSGDNSLYFPRAFAQGSWTYPSLFSFLTARYPFNCGVSRIAAEGDGYLSLCTDFDESCPTIFSLLRQNGYRVGSILDGWGFTIRNTAGQEHREDRYFEQNWGWMAGQGRRFLSLEEQRDASVAFMRQSATGSTGELLSNDRPFFLFLRSLYTHSPYRDIFPSSEYVTTLSRRRWQFRLVEGFVRGLQTFEEVYLQALVDTLQELNRLDDTLIILSSDHGDMFWNVEDDLRAAGVSDEEVWRHQLEPYNALTKVPLFIWGAGISGVYRERFRLMDVVPTLLDELGIAYEPQVFDGVSLYREGARPLYADSAGYGNGGIAFQDGGPKLMMSGRLGAVRYDISDDEYETLARRNDGLKTVSRTYRRETVADFEAFLQQAARDPQAIAASSPAEEDSTGHEDALMRRLQALGYI